MSSDGTISWYAYQDPKSGREYFHEPVSNQTTWVLPTSRLCSADSIAQHRSTKKDGEKSAGQTKPMGATSHHNPHVWSAVGMAVVFVLVVNTLFLLLLVKVLRDSNEMQDNALNIRLPGDHMMGAIIDANPKSAVEISLPSVDEVGLGIDTQCSSTNVAAEIRENYRSQLSTDLEDGRYVGESNEGGSSEVKSKNKNAKPKGYVGGKEREKSRDAHDSVTPIRCWVPFSYILLRKCRQQARAGLPMPLANAENFLLI